jgi:small conductance mechanosensitive channel
MLQELFQGYPGWVAPAASLTLAIVVAAIVADIVARLVRIPLVRLLESTDIDFWSPVIRRPVRMVRVVTFLVTTAALALPALEVAGFKFDVGTHPEALVKWLLESGLRIALIILLAYALIRIVATVVTRLERDVARQGGPAAFERGKRVQTLGNLVRNAVAVIVSGAALMMVLRELNIDIVPLLTGAGILGLAVGFGAQTLVKDVISGFFLIFEDQVRVGDVAVINGQTGTVEDITLRTIVLRDIEGTVHVFPNGSINTLANRSKDYAYFLLDVSVAYKEKTDHVTQVLRDTADELRADPAFGPSILEPLDVLGLEMFSDNAVVIRSRIKTLPHKNFEVGRELRRRLKTAFDREGIEIPFPQRVMHVVTAEGKKD